MTLEDEEDNDPTITNLVFLDYRYLRFCYQPVEDKFMLNNGWKDPLWKKVKNLRNGLDADERDRREQVFGANVIEIEQKSIPQLLVGEVSFSGIHLYLNLGPDLKSQFHRHSILSTYFRLLV